MIIGKLIPAGTGYAAMQERLLQEAEAEAAKLAAEAEAAKEFMEMEANESEDSEDLPIAE